MSWLGRPWVDRVVLGLAVILALYRLAGMLTAAHLGVEFSDEGYYLVWIQQAFSFPQSVTQFGFVYHSLYEWLGGDIARLRQANILITWVLAWTLTLFFFRRVLVLPWPAAYWRSAPMLALAGVLATTFPNLLGQWLPTPSYNTLALQGVLLAGIGLMLAQYRGGVGSLAGCVLLGVGGWLAFMSKPSTAAALAVVSALYLVLAKRARLRWIAGAALVSTALLVASALLIDGSVQAFIDRVGAGAGLIGVMGVAQPIWMLFLRFGYVQLGAAEALALVLVLLTLLLANMRVFASDPAKRLAGSGALLLLLAASALLASGMLGLPWGQKRFNGLSIWAVPLAAALCARMLQLRFWAGGWARSHVAVALCFMALPFAFAFGTGNSYWSIGANAGIFWVLSGLALLAAVADHRLAWRAFLPMALGAQLVGMMSWQAAIDYPYRQTQALGIGAQEVRFGGPGAYLAIEAGYAQYLTTLRLLADGAGFQPGTPMIDLTGHSPGALFGLGARVLGQPWLLGGYPGSERFATVVLAQVPCEQLAQAWLLMDPLGPRPVPHQRVLASIGGRLEQDYAKLGSLDTPAGFGDYATGSQQQLYKPARALGEALQSCRAARGESP